MGEVCVRILYSQISGYNLEMWRYAADLKQVHADANLPFSHVPNSRGVYYGVPIEINSLGFRDYEYTVNKPHGAKRILFLGDSFTLGWGVPLNNIFPKRLEHMLNKEHPKVEVINLGVGNYNSMMEHELFKSQGLRLNPDLVVLVYFVNDAEPTPQPSRFRFIIKYSYFAAFLTDQYIKARHRLLRSMELDAYYRHIYSPDSAALSLNRTAIKKLIALCRLNNIKLLLVNFPELREFRNYPYMFATEYIRDIADSNNTPFLDLMNYLSPVEPSSLWVSDEDPHPNIKAHAVAAEAIYDKITKDELL